LDVVRLADRDQLVQVERCAARVAPFPHLPHGPPGRPAGVTDPNARVIGVHNLHVADASIMPRVTRTNINLPSIMIGEGGRSAAGGTVAGAPSVAGKESLLVFRFFIGFQ
jgi:hypothetical protein